MIGGQYPQGSTPGEYEVIYAVLYNNGATATIPGGHVCYDHTVTSGFANGRAVILPATANLNFYAGCTPDAIPATSWGLVLIHGIIDACAVDGGTTDANLSTCVIPTNGSYYANAPIAHVVGTTAILQGYGWITVMSTLTTTSGLTRCLIRAM